MSPRSAASPDSVSALFDHLAPRAGWRRAVPAWPPDAFALAASALAASAGYTRLVSSRWPPRSRAGRTWQAWVAGIGTKWRETACKKRAAPSAVAGWWRTVVQRADRTSLHTVCDDEILCFALLQVSAAADEACYGVGSPPLDTEMQRIAARRLWRGNLLHGATLCDVVPPGRVRVLPKMHTPRSGITIRSISHHLALCSSEVRPYWYITDASTKFSLNLLLAPWPLKVRPCEIKPSRMVRRARAGRAYRTFTYEPRSRWSVGDLLRLIDDAVAIGGRVDGVILPELAMEAGQVDALLAALAPERRPRVGVVIAGVGSTAVAEAPGRNYALIATWDRTWKRYIRYEQDKHHRWRLDPGQIRQYGLGAHFELEAVWWEHIDVRSRRLNFVAMRPWLTACVLICEDLARADPVGDVLRAVGPNLVVALLMDGPQLPSRWGARYATVLADDPGSSVLTVTSFGMARLSRAQGKPRSGVVALWKDALDGEANELELPEGAGGLLLTLSRNRVQESTADGRNDRGSTAYLRLTGVHEVPLGER